jgi:hypothetical protein
MMLRMTAPTFGMKFGDWLLVTEEKCVLKGGGYS